MTLPFHDARTAYEYVGSLKPKTMSEQPINDGGSAFPSQEIDLELGHYEGRYEVKAQHPGMTLLDYFAAKAMAGWLASYSREGDTHPVSNDCADSVARMSYDLAHAMLRARTQPEAK